MGDKYLGIYCAQCDEWLYRVEDGYILFYPAREIAEAHLKTIAKDWHLNSAQVVQFGRERREDVNSPAFSGPLCSVIISKLNQEAYRRTWATECETARKKAMEHSF